MVVEVMPWDDRFNGFVGTETKNEETWTKLTWYVSECSRDPSLFRRNVFSEERIVEESLALDRWKQGFGRTGEAKHRSVNYFSVDALVAVSVFPSLLFVGRLSSSKVAFQFSAHKDKSEVATAEVWIINFASSVFSDPLAPWRVTL